MKRYMVALLAILLANAFAVGAVAEGIELGETSPHTGTGARESVLWTEAMEQAERERASVNDVEMPGEALAIDAASFPDAHFRAYVAENCDTNGDGVLSEAERLAVTSIAVSGENIGSLSGIEYFTGLTGLSCSDNRLAKLDLRQNTQLLQLDCGSNRLKKLYLGKNMKLETLMCSNNKLTAVDVSGCRGLVEFDCQSNALKALDCSQCPGLVSLNCRRNKLARLTLGNARLENLLCYGNKLKQIDIAKCPILRKYVNYYAPYEFMEGQIIWEMMEGYGLHMDAGTKLYAGKALLYRLGNPTSVAFRKKKLTTRVGKNEMLEIVMKPAGVKAYCRFTNSNEDIMYVSDSGKLESWGKGTAVVTVTTSNGRSASIRVTVK